MNTHILIHGCITICSDFAPSLPLLSLFLSFIFFPTSFRRQWAAFLECLMSSASIQKLFCGICSAFKCSFDEFVGEKVVSLSYSSVILGLPPPSYLLIQGLLLFSSRLLVTHKNYIWMESLESICLPQNASWDHYYCVCIAFIGHFGGINSF